MYTYTADRFAVREEIVAFVDRYQLHEQHRRHNYKIDPHREAQTLKLLFGVLGRRKRLVAILNEDDKDAIQAYGSEGYEIHTMNGDRPQALLQLLNGEYKHTPPEHLVIISNDTSFGGLCAFAAQNNTRVAVWAPTGRIPDDFVDPRFDTRYLNELLPETYIQLGTIAIWLDIENLLISLKTKGLVPDIKVFVDAIRAETEDLGDTAHLVAYGDYGLLEETLGYNVQRELEKLGVRTRYQINLHGKNSADMEIASDIHTYIEHDPTVKTVIIGTGDRDFRPSVDAAHAKGKKVIILALKDNLSQELKRAADDVRYLDKYFLVEAPQQIPVDTRDTQMLFLLRFAHFLNQHDWRWTYRDRLPTDIASVELLNQALERGLLQEQGDLNSKLSINMNQLLAQTAQHVAWWLVGRIDHLIRQKGMPYVDTNFLIKGMQMDKRCQELGIGQNWTDARDWLEAANEAGLIVKTRQPHPRTPNKFIDTWWPVGDSPVQQPSEKPVSEEDKGSEDNKELPLDQVTGF